MELRQVGQTSRGVIGEDADFIVDCCLPGLDAWNGKGREASRERRGVVMGAVQSGKTASMLAVIAKAVDAGVDAVVVLAGTRTALWLQTMDRLRAQIDTFPDRVSRRVILPDMEANDVASGAVALDSLYSLTDQLAARAVKRGLPLIAVVMKQVAHLERMADTLHNVVYPQVAALDRPFRLLVVDDEADDSSIAESDLTVSSTFQERQVPRRIVDLWESRRVRGHTAIPQLYASYLAYTATPQANFLQDSTNPLAPTDFVVCLRTPGAEGDPAKRDPGYRVPEGLPGWYTGGDVYYKTLNSVPLCAAFDEQLTQQERLVDAIRAYLIACAVRVARDPNGLSPRQAVARTFGSAEEAKRVGGQVMCMLVHPSAAKDAQFATAATILAWSAGLPDSEGAVLFANGQRTLVSSGVVADIDTNTHRWTAWFEAYRSANLVVADLPGDTPNFPELDWPGLRGLIVDEILPAVSVAVINSDELADDRPQFEPVRDGESWRAAPNLNTIFVSGNVMSRGLTLEGLSTTLFTRSSGEPASDTQMQMQRWFGYRGAYVDVCRVLVAADQLELFEQYHETDVALRAQILNAMSSGVAASPTVLQGRSFRATSKIRNLTGTPLWPGPDAFMTFLNSPTHDMHNQELVADLFQAESQGVPDDESRQGRLLLKSLSLLETAALLDEFRYPSSVDSGGVDPIAEANWRAVERVAGLGTDDPYGPLFRMPDDTDARAWRGASPFHVAAYLRFWALCLEEGLPAAFTTDEPPLLWSLIDLNDRRSEAPMFRVGLRFGQGPIVGDGPLTRLPWPISPMQRMVTGSQLDAGWGSRNYRDGVLWGDEFFDCYPSGVLPKLTPSRARARGSDGLLLLHVIEHETGVAIAPALSIPVGGPDQVQAKVRRRNV